MTSKKILHLVELFFLPTPE